METIFWICATLVFYIYLGYPILLKLAPQKPYKKDSEAPKIFPKITILIPAYNEEEAIETTIKNKLTLNYPANLLEIIVISDESEDGTDTIVQRIAKEDERIKLIRQVPRQGKTAGLNLAVPQASGELVCFSDANSIYDENALVELASCFSDPDIGYATGKMIYVNSDGSIIGDGCSAYMKYENYIRAAETKVGSVVGVDGGIDVIRKHLYRPMNPDQLPDFVLPLKVITQNKRVIYCDKALLKEETLHTTQSEYRMRVRVSLRAYWALWDMRYLFNTSKYGLFSIQLMSHKALRYLAFVPLTMLFATSVFLIFESGFYFLAMITQAIFYFAAWYASTINTKNRLLRLANYFCLINVASAMAFFKFIQGQKITIWKPRTG